MTKIHARQALTPQGWRSYLDITVGEDGLIESVATHVGDADHVLDLVLPAPVNLHSHAFQRAMSGLTEARGPDRPLS